MNHNRIGAKCWFREYDHETHSVKDWKQGRLLAWSTDHEEYEAGPGPYPVGVVESDETGICHSVSVPRICFAPVPPPE